MKVCVLTCTSGRHTLLERVVRCFLEQDYEDKVMLIYQNSDVYQQLDPSLENENIILVNQHLDSKTGLPYTDLGSIYNDAINHIPEDVDIVNMFDDDDVFLPNHLSLGVNGYIKAENRGMVAYKPKFSYYRHAGGIQKMCNIFEPSIFVSARLLKDVGCHENTENQHHKWLDVVGSNILVEDYPNNSTLIYDWNSPVPCFKTSGNPSEKQNFNNYRTFSKDHGDKIISAGNINDVLKIFGEVVQSKNIN